MASGHFVAGLELTLHRDEHFDHLEHPRGQLVAALQLLDAIFVLGVDDANGLIILHLDSLEIALARVVSNGDFPPFKLLDCVEQVSVDCRALLYALRRSANRLAKQHFAKSRPARAIEDRTFVVAILGEAFLFLGLNRTGTVINVDTVTVEDAHLDDRAGNTGRQTKRRVADV